MAAKDDLGRRGEELAAQFLGDAGYTIIDRNWRCARGEIDLVARDGNDTVFIEVKTRSSTAFGHPFEAITVQKLARLRRLAHAWCEAHPQGSGSVHVGPPLSDSKLAGSANRRELRNRAIRIDAISVIAATGCEPTIEHLRRVY